MTNYLQFTVLLVTILLTQGHSSKELACRLEWKAASTGGRLPGHLVEIHNGGLQYAVRSKFEETERYVLGTYDPKHDSANFPVKNENSTTTSLPSFEMLTNPHGCTLSWPQLSHGALPNFGTPADKDDADKTYVGRVMIDETWLAGQVEPRNQRIVVVADDDLVESRTTYQVLSSYSQGLRLEVSEFQFANDPFGSNQDYLGMDEIHNNGDIEITQKSEHFKKIVEVSSISTKNETTSSKTESSGFDMHLLGKSKKAEHTYKETVEETFTTTTETEVRMTKSITIPPYSSITVCTTVTIQENYTSDFTAKGAYHALGMTAREIQDLLKDEGIEGTTIVGDEVVVNIAGTFSGSLAMNTQFIAVPSDDPNGCMSRQELLFEQKRRAKMLSDDYYQCDN